MSPTWSVIILSGGTSRRFGSDKAQALLGDHSLLNEILISIPVSTPVLLVGPEPTGITRQVSLTQEDPPYGGPVAGIDAGIAQIDTELVAIIATDMPFAVAVVESLILEITSEDDVLLPLDANGYPQFLSGIYRTTALKSALLGITQVQGAAMRDLVTGMRVRHWHSTPAQAAALVDIDTREDLERARRIHRSASTIRSEGSRIS